MIVKKLISVIEKVMDILFKVGLLMLTEFENPKKDMMMSEYRVVFAIVWFSFFIRVGIEEGKGEGKKELKGYVISTAEDVAVAFCFSILWNIISGKNSFENLAAALVVAIYAVILTIAVYGLKWIEQIRGHRIYYVCAFAGPVATVLITAGMVEWVAASVSIAIVSFVLLFVHKG